MDALDELIEQWREDAETLERQGFEDAADRLRARAQEVEEARRERARDELTVAEAAEVSGYSPERLRELVREGKLPDRRPEGAQGEIRIPRWSLPRKPAFERGERVPAHSVDEDAGDLDSFLHEEILP